MPSPISRFLSARYYEESKAGDAIAALKASLKPQAIVKRDNKWIDNFDSSLLVPGDLVQVRAQ
jgi:H+-transporting ATPase